MARIPPSIVPPKMYRHFALVTVLLTTSVAMFAEGENRQAAAIQSEPLAERDENRQDDIQIAEPTTSRRPDSGKRSYRGGGGFNGFDPTFGAPMENPVASLVAQATELTSGAPHLRHADDYLASLDAERRALLAAELEKEGFASPNERERKTAALIAASEARSGTPTANY